jgi:hypothetical protein
MSTLRVKPHISLVPGTLWDPLWDPLWVRQRKNRPWYLPFQYWVVGTGMTPEMAWRMWRWRMANHPSSMI